MTLPRNAPESDVSQELGIFIERLQADNSRLQKQNEELQQALLRYADLYEEAPAGYIIFNGEGVLREVNHTAAQMLGMSLANLDRRLFVQLVCPDDQELFQRNLSRFIATGKPHQYELRLMRGDTALIWAQLKLENLLTDAGQPCYRATMTDITKYHQVMKVLKESEERYRLVSSLMSDYVFKLRLTDEGDTVMELLTDGFYRDTGLTFEDVKTPDLWERIIHPGDYKTFQTEFHKLVSQGGKSEIECRTHVKDKRMRWVQIAARAVPDVGMTRTVAIVGSVKDITRRKRMETALFERSQQLYNLADNLPNAVIYQVVGDLDGNRRFTYVGRSIERLNEISVGELVADPSALYRQFLPKYQRLVANLEKTALEKRMSVDVEVQSILPSGRLRWFRFTSTPRKLDDGSMVWDGVEVDITDRKAAEVDLEERIAERTIALSQANQELEQEIRERARVQQALAESERRLLEAQRLSHVGSWYLELDTDTASWSEEFYTIVGMDPGQPAPGYQTSRELFTEESWEPLSKAVNETLQSGAPYEVQACLIRVDGEKRHVICRGQLQRDEEGSPKALFGTVQDVTEWKQAEEERKNLEAQVQYAQKMESLGVLAGGIAHDFNNLLQIILANVNMMQKVVNEGDAATSFIENIEKSVVRAASLTKQMLAYSGKAHISPERMDINRVVCAMTDLIKSSVSKNIGIRMELMRGVPLIEGDVAQIGQVVLNLVMNACEALDEKHGGTVIVKTMVLYCSDAYLLENRAMNTCAEGDYVCLEVADAGCGMDEETQARLFDPFFSTKFTGRGLGMASVLGIMRSHKGSILIDSSPGRGTVIRALFPALSGGVADAPEEAVPVILSPPPEDAGTILLVDDEPEMVELGALSLRQLGYSVFTAGDGLEALEVFKKHLGDIDCVLLDLSMPRMDGAQALSELRRIKPDVRVVLMSGWAEQELETQFADKHVQGFVEKPFDITTLASKLKAALR